MTDTLREHLRKAGQKGGLAKGKRKARSPEHYAKMVEARRISNLGVAARKKAKEGKEMNERQRAALEESNRILHSLPATGDIVRAIIANDNALRDCICSDPENCVEPIPNRRCKAGKVAESL